MSRGLSRWSARDTHRGFATTHDLAIRLTLALRPVQAAIRVVDDSVPPMVVSWSAVHEDEKGNASAMSYTNFGRNKINISPMPIIHAGEGKISDEDAIDVVTGFALHEAGHAEHTRPVYDILLVKDAEGQESPAFRPLRLAAYLLNLVEDVRVEGLVAERWPGFAPYFPAVLDYMWDHVGEREQPEDDSKPKFPAITKRLKTVFYALRYPARWTERVDGSEAPEVAWWQSWQDDYISGRVDAPETIRRGLEHLRDQSSECQSEMEQMEGMEREAEKAEKNLRKLLRQMIEEGIEGAPIVCINEDGEESQLDAETAETVRQMIREEMEQIRPKPVDGLNVPPMIIRKPEESSASRRAFGSGKSSTVEAMRSALVFRAANPDYLLRVQREGVIDDEELYRAGYGDSRIFAERVIEHKPDVLMGLLVDLSGSMNGQKLQTAQELAQIFVWALHDQDGVTTRVWGHTGDQGGVEVDLFRLWETGDPLSRLGLIQTIDHSNNYDSLALSYVIDQMRYEPQPQKVIIVLSDGIPSGTGYGGETGMNHVRAMVERAQRYGIEVIQIAIDSDLRPEDQSRMYKTWLPYRTTEELPRQLTKVMSRWT